MAENSKKKMTWVALRQDVAKQTKYSEQDVNKFLNAMIAAITDTLQAERQIKINNLGQFRLQTVAARKSVSVATGEAIQLDEHNKICFTPEISLKEELSGDAPAKLVPNSDPLQKLSEQADEINGLLAEMGMGNTPLPEDEGEKTEVEGKPTEEETQVQEKNQEEPAEKPQEEEKKHPEEKKEEKKPFRPWLTALLTILVFCLLLMIGYFFLQHKIEVWTETLRQHINAKAANNAEFLTNETDTAAPDTVEFIGRSLEEEERVEAVVQTPINDIFNPDAKRDYSELITIEKVNQDSRLAWIAYRYYHNKDLWVFLYEANRDVVKQPSVLLVGTRLRIPKLSDELRDTNNPQTRALIEALQEKYLQLN